MCWRATTRLTPEVDSLPAGFSARWLGEELRSRLGFTGAIFTDDLNMTAASVVGSMPERAGAALAAGCDALCLCNNRQGVLQVIESLRGSGDPVSQVRLARLHGEPGQERIALRATPAWQASNRAVEACMERPSLRLDA